MDMKITQKKIPWKSYLEGFSKYKYIALVVLIGLVLLFWPTESGTQTEMQKQQTQHTEVVGGQLEQKLEKILSQIDGVGDCSVMLDNGRRPGNHLSNEHQQADQFRRPDGGDVHRTDLPREALPRSRWSCSSAIRSIREL